MSTSGRNIGCAVTSATRSPAIHTSRPSCSEARYSSPVLIMRCSSSPSALALDGIDLAAAGVAATGSADQPAQHGLELRRAERQRRRLDALRERVHVVAAG